MDIDINAIEPTSSAVVLELVRQLREAERAESGLTSWMVS